MIPVLVVAGLVLGRWWRSALVAAAVVWPALLLADGTLAFGWGLLGAAALAVANTLVGALVHQGALWAVRRVRPQRGRAAARGR